MDKSFRAVEIFMQQKRCLKWEFIQRRKISRISKERKIELFETIRDILQESIENGGSTISDYRNINGEAGRHATSFENVWEETMFGV